MLTRASLKNPYTVFAICMSMLVLSGMSYQKMVMSIFPEIKAPTLLVTTFYRGVSPSGEKILSFLKHKKIAGHSDFHETDDAFLRGDHSARCFDPAAFPLVVPMEDSLIS
jgi:hypothetical protein